MRLLLIHDTLDYMEGAEILFLDQIKLLRKLGFEVLSFSFTRDTSQGWPDYRFQESKFVPKRIFEKIIFNYKAYSKLKEIIHKFQPDLIHIYHNHLYPLSILFAFPSSIPIIQSINDCQLIYASCWGVNKKTSSLIKESGLDKKVVYYNNIPENQLVDLYNLADVFVYPSIREGFGFPVLEAISCGCPVITSNTSSLPEIAVNSAILIDPYDLNALTSAIKKVLTDEILRKKMIEKGLKQVIKFTWGICARETL